MSEKTTRIKDWLLYVEDDKMKAFDITGHEDANTDQLVALCNGAEGVKIFGYVAFEHERDATFYGDMHR
jgi:hypothetical protein